jgi:hypothetical protein
MFLSSPLSQFNSALEAVYTAQSGWTIADSRLKASVRRVIRQDVIKPYTALYQQFVSPPPGPLEWTSNRSKYVKYDPKRLLQMVESELFSGQAMVLSKMMP